MGRNQSDDGQVRLMGRNQGQCSSGEQPRLSIQEPQSARSVAQMSCPWHHVTGVNIFVNRK